MNCLKLSQFQATRIFWTYYKTAVDAQILQSQMQFAIAVDVKFGTIHRSGDVGHMIASDENFRKTKIVAHFLENIIEVEFLYIKFVESADIEIRYVAAYSGGKDRSK